MRRGESSKRDEGGVQINIVAGWTDITKFTLSLLAGQSYGDLAELLPELPAFEKGQSLAKKGRIFPGQIVGQLASLIL